MPGFDAVFTIVFTNVVIAAPTPPQGCLLSFLPSSHFNQVRIMFMHQFIRFVTAVSTLSIAPVLSSMMQWWYQDVFSKLRSNIQIDLFTLYHCAA
jgi:hypothetical protein